MKSYFHKSWKKNVRILFIEKANFNPKLYIYSNLFDETLFLHIVH